MQAMTRPMGQSITKANSGQFVTRYEVIREFKYGDRILKVGEQFQPIGGRNDALIMAGVGKYVKRVEIPLTQ